MPNAAPREPCRVLITGAHGFVGARLASTLAQKRPEWLLDMPQAPEVDGGLDITDAASVAAHVTKYPPQLVVHLAAVAAVADSVRRPRLAWDINLGGTLNLVLALQAHAPGAFLLYVSSAEIYGASFAEPGPADERRLLAPVNPYAASKAAADLLVRQAAATGLRSCIMRPFNHTGAGQSEAFVAPNFAAQIARIEAGLAPPVISVGSLDDERDFLNVADVVAAYVLALESCDKLGRGEVFNVASGVPVRIGEVLERLMAMSTVSIDVRIDPARLRQARIKRVVGDASALSGALGWRPTYSLDQTLTELMDDQRRRVSQRPEHAT